MNTRSSLPSSKMLARGALAFARIMERQAVPTMERQVLSAGVRHFSPSASTPFRNRPWYGAQDDIPRQAPQSMGFEQPNRSFSSLNQVDGHLQMSKECDEIHKECDEIHTEVMKTIDMCSELGKMFDKCSESMTEETRTMNKRLDQITTEVERSSDQTSKDWDELSKTIQEMWAKQERAFDRLEAELSEVGWTYDVPCILILAFALVYTCGGIKIAGVDVLQNKNGSGTQKDLTSEVETHEPHTDEVSDLIKEPDNEGQSLSEDCQHEQKGENKLLEKTGDNDESVDDSGHEQKGENKLPEKTGDSDESDKNNPWFPILTGGATVRENGRITEKYEFGIFGKWGSRSIFPWKW